MSFVTSLVTTIALAAGLAACATDSSPTQGQTNGALGQKDSTGTGTASSQTCQSYLDQIDEVCYPTDKSYTPDESAACVGQQQHNYERCKLTAACQAQFDAATQACGGKTTAGSPCFEQAQQAFETCLGRTDTGTAP